MNQEHANRLLVLGVLTKIVARLDREVRAAVDMDPGDRKAAYANGRRIGAVTMTDPKPAYRVTDRDAFRAWVKDHRPDEIVIIESVRSSYEQASSRRVRRGHRGGDPRHGAGRRRPTSWSPRRPGPRRRSGRARHQRPVVR